MTWSPKRTAAVRPFHKMLPGCSFFTLTESFLSTVAKKIDELQESLRKKDEDMKQMEERYKRYVEKARTVSSWQEMGHSVLNM